MSAVCFNSDFTAIPEGEAGALVSESWSYRAAAGWKATPDIRARFDIRDGINLPAIAPGQVFRRWRHNGAALVPVTGPAPLPAPDPVALFYAANPPSAAVGGQPWALGVTYAQGDTCTEGGQTWSARQAHRSDAPGWSPTSPGTAALWTLVPPAGAGAWAAGVVYALPALVTYTGRRYQLVQGHTSIAGWEPPNVPALWTDIGLA